MKDSKPLVGIDASRALVSQKTGIENYTYQLLRAVASLDCQFSFRLYTRPFSKRRQKDKFQIPGFKNSAVREINWPHLWTQAGLAIETWRNPPDLLFIPAHVIPYFKNPAVHTVVTVHDLRTEFLPQHDSLVQKIYLNRFTERLRAKLATHIIAVSQSTKQDVVQRLGVSSDKISVVYEGVDRRRFVPKIRKEKSEIQKKKEKYDIRGSYVLFVGTVQPRKNLVRLIEAFSRLLRQGGEQSKSPLSGSKPADLNLVLAGGKGWLSDKIYAAPEKFGIEDRVNFIGYVDDKDLPYLYAGAEMLALPSLYEGFGLPVLEAMAVGIPVLTSKISSLPEVGGEAAYYVDPESVDSITRGLEQVLGDPRRREAMIEQGYKQVGKFSWEQAAKQTCKMFAKVLSSRKEYHAEKS